jgi:hypothetical protein
VISSTQMPRSTVGAYCNDLGGGFVEAPLISVGVPELIWGSHITI